MADLAPAIDQVSLVARNYGDADAFEAVLLDWFEFIGGKPGEVVVVDAGSPPETHDVYFDLFRRGLIDKLQVINASHLEHDHERGFVQLNSAGLITSKPYLLWFNIDTLPYRRENDGWLAEAISFLDRDEIAVVGGAFNAPARIRDAWDGWYLSDKCSLNLALMKRTLFFDALFEFAYDFVRSGYATENPAREQERYFIEVAIERFMETHNMFNLCKMESENWTVFHTNVHGSRLQDVRERYRARVGVERYMNLGAVDVRRVPGEATYSGEALYYGQPLVRQLIANRRVRFGRSRAGLSWRSLKRRFRDASHGKG